MFSLVVKPRIACAALVAVALMSSRSALAQQATTAPEAAPTESELAAEATPPEPVAPPPTAPVVAAPVPVEAPIVPPPAPVAPPPAASPALKLTDSFFTRYEVRENYDDLGIGAGRFAESDVTVFRARFGLATTLDVGAGEQVVIQFTPQASGIIGSLSGTVADANLGLHEGYLRIQGESHKFDAGRFEMNYGESLIIGNLDWHETARSFDGLRMRVLPGAEKTYVDFFLTQASPLPIAGEGGRTLNNPLGAGDSYFAGIYSGLGGYIDPAMELDAYLLGLISPGTDLPGDAMAMTPDAHRNASTLFTLGARFKHAVDIVDMRAEGGLQFGGAGQTAPVGTDPAEGPSIFAYQLDAEVGASFMEKKFRVGLEGLIASGNDPSTADTNEGWNQLFPTAHKFLGLMDIMGARSNVISGVLHLSAQPMPDLKANIDVHMFSRTQATTLMADNSGFAGVEVDAGLSYALGAGLAVRGLYGMFAPGEDVYGSDQSVAHYVEIELRHDLK